MNMTEADTRAELIDKELAKSKWESVGDVLVKREYVISNGKISANVKARKTLSADYVLIYKNVKLAVVEAKKYSKSYTEGVAQAKDYAGRLNTKFAFSTNGRDIYQINMNTGEEKLVNCFPTPEELWNMSFKVNNELFNIFSSIKPYVGLKTLRYYQENAINAVMEALSNGKDRILLTLATGTGKTFIASQIVWKLVEARWNLNSVGERLPKILFLADRNILVNQAKDDFKIFPQNSLCRIFPDEIKKYNRVPTAQSIFFTIFQTFMSGDTPYFKKYSPDFFDFIIIDECHRGGARDDGNWRSILEYFSPAVQLGLTATPKRKDNVDTYKYFGEPVYSYSLKDGINDGYLTPFVVKNITDNFTKYKYDVKDEVEGDIDIERVYEEKDFNKVIEIKERERKRVEYFMNDINQSEKTIVFCASQYHAGIIRNIINQIKTGTTNTDYCARVCANDGDAGEQLLLNFRDNEKSIPTILTTSTKLSTGVDVAELKNIVLLRPINSMIEFKQIIGRGTRTYNGKYFFTIYDFVGASKNFEDKEWDGEVEYIETNNKNYQGSTSNCDVENEDNYDLEGVENIEDEESNKIISVKLGKDREVKVINKKIIFYSKISGKMLDIQDILQEFIENTKNIFKDKNDFCKNWQDVKNRNHIINELADLGFDEDFFNKLKTSFNFNNTDIFDMILFLVFKDNMLFRKNRVDKNRKVIFDNLNNTQNDFINFLVEQYINDGEKNFNKDKLGDLILLKYNSINDAIKLLGDIKSIKELFYNFQKNLYS